MSETGAASVQAYGKFMRRLGHRVVEAESGSWYDAQCGFYFRFPHHRVSDPSDDEMRSILRRRFCMGARYFVPMSSVGKPSYLMVCSDPSYDMTSVDKHSARRDTRRGLEHFTIRQMPLPDLADLGHALYHDTLLRQGRDPRVWTDAGWRRYCEATDGLDGFTAWGAFADGELAAFLLTFLMEDHLTILHQCSATRFLHSYPNNALVFVVTREALDRPEVTTVQYGPQSLDAPPSLDEFKRTMGYVRRPMKQRVVFNPVVRPFVGGVSHGVVQRASALRPQSDTLRKLDGIMRFYRQTA